MLRNILTAALAFAVLPAALAAQGAAPAAGANPATQAVKGPVSYTHLRAHET